MTGNKLPKASIEVVEIKDYLMYFYWGRHLNDEMMDMRLGGGSFAIYKEDRAVIIDTMARPGQGAWVRNYMELSGRKLLGFNSEVQRAVGRIPEKVKGNQGTFWDDD